MNREKALKALEDGVEIAETHGSGQILMAGDESEEILSGLSDLGVDEEALLLPNEDGGFVIVPGDADNLDDGVTVEASLQTPADD